MAVEDRLEILRGLTERVRRYAQLASTDSFTEDTLDELKTNAKALCDDMKDEITLIKTDIDAWGG